MSNSENYDKVIEIFQEYLLWSDQSHLSTEHTTGFVQVLENLESHGNLKFQNPGLENLENMCWSLKVLEN